jgi:LmbE family N-acetylglucosaminyl deacetylase
MTALPQFSGSSRLLVFAPHPDDETLATGGLIQAALLAGAAVRVVFATDGDNNPWPQRWLERRWRIGAGERARWGARRRREAVGALAVLGVERKDAVCFLGWPDQGLTDGLMRDDHAVDVLADEISRFSPTHLAMPTLADRHPDHSALRVMLELALLRIGSSCLRLGYVVHGTRSAAASRQVDGDTPLLPRKQRAMEMYASQMSLSRRRLLALAARTEQFDVAEAPMATPDDASALRIPRFPGWPWHRRHELLLIVAAAKETLRLRVPIPATAATTLTCVSGRMLPVVSTSDALVVTLPVLAKPLSAVFAKFHRMGPRLVIFDRQFWYDADELLRVQEPASPRQVVPGLG